MRIAPVAAMRPQILSMGLSLVVLVNATSGCTLFGLGLGSYSHTMEPVADLNHVAKGDTITLGVETRPELTGLFDGLSGESLYLERNSVEVTIPVAMARQWATLRAEVFHLTDADVERAALDLAARCVD